MRTSLLMFASMLAACGDPTTTTQASSSAPLAPLSVSAPSAVATGIGVPECDEYVARMRVCIEKAPAEERDAREKSVDEIEKNWKSQAGSTDSKERMTTACRSALAEFQKSPGCEHAKGVEVPTPPR